MIRSLIAYLDTGDDEFIVRRNLERASLEREVENGCRAWIDIVDPEGDEIDWIARQLALNPTIVSDLHREDRRPSLLVYPEYLFLSLFQPQIQQNRVKGREIHCVVTNNLFVTVRQAEANAVDDAYDRVTNNPAAWHSGPAYFLYLTSQHVIDAYYPLLDRISGHLNTLEERLLNGGVDEKKAQRPVYGIKQQLINLRQMVAPQREVFSSVIGEKRVSESSDTRDLFRHLYERLLRVYDVIDSQRDLSSNVLDMMQNQESRRLVEAVNRLTVLSMIFLPLTFFTGFFDLNFATTTDPFALPISGSAMMGIVLAGMIVSATVMTIFFKKRGWL